MLNRNYEEHSLDLVQKIINASIQVPQKQSFFDLVNNAFKDIYLPKPSYVLPLLFVFGFVLSVFFNTQETIAEELDELYIQGEYYE